VRSPAHEHVEGKDSVGGILVMSYEKLPIVRRDNFKVSDSLLHRFKLRTSSRL
jgi:hypothetical protein